MLRRVIGSAVIAGLLLGSIVACARDGRAVATRSRTATPAAPAPAPTPAISPPPGDPTVVTIGDSIMFGLGVGESNSWPELMGRAEGWQLTNLGCDGGGFLVIGSCGDTFAGIEQRAARLQPRTVIIQGTSNDFGQDADALSTRTFAVIQQLRADLPDAQIIGLSTVWSDSETDLPSDDTDAVNADVRQAVEQVGGVYLDLGAPLNGHPEWMQPDNVHPTIEGQQAIFAAVQAAFAKARLSV